MQGIIDLFSSERGIIGLALIIGATVLTAIGVMSIDAWTTYTFRVFAVYAAAKTITGAVSIMGATSAAKASLAVAAAPAAAVETPAP